MEDDLPTYTYCWELERKFWRLFEIELPRPVGLAEIMTFLGTFLLCLLLGYVTGISVTWDDVGLLILIPGAVAYLSTQRLDVFDGRKPHDWAVVQLRFLLWDPRHLARLEPAPRHQKVRVRKRVWNEVGADWMEAHA